MALLNSIAAGNHKALASLFDSLAPVVLGLLVRILSRRSLAEEVLQEVFLQAWRQAGQHRPELCSVRDWLLLIAWSRGHDRLRQEEYTTCIPTLSEALVGA